MAEHCGARWPRSARMYTRSLSPPDRSASAAWAKSGTSLHHNSESGGCISLLHPSTFHILYFSRRRFTTGRIAEKAGRIGCKLQRAPSRPARPEGASERGWSTSSTQKGRKEPSTGNMGLTGKEKRRGVLQVPDHCGAASSTHREPSRSLAACARSSVQRNSRPIEIQKCNVGSARHRNRSILNGSVPNTPASEPVAEKIDEEEARKTAALQLQVAASSALRSLDPTSDAVRAARPSTSGRLVVRAIRNLECESLEVCKMQLEHVLQSVGGDSDLRLEPARVDVVDGRHPDPLQNCN